MVQKIPSETMECCGIRGTFMEHLGILWDQGESDERRSTKSHKTP
jgi:hypothetical protein